MKLYWVTTEDYDEDWFIVASSAEEASKFHEDAEGYHPGNATAEEILIIPDDVSAESGWPSYELLLALGAKFIVKYPSRVIEINGRNLSEELLEGYINEIVNNASERLGQERLNKMHKTHLH